MNRIVLMSLVASIFVMKAGAADPAAPATAPAAPEVRRIIIGSSPMPVPAMKYRLLPDALDLQPGNAATLYLVATSRNLIGNLEAWVEEAPIDEWLAMPIDRLPRAEAERYVERFHKSLHQIELGARRETCHWDMPYRQDGFGTLLPYLADLRMIARALALKARLQIADGQYADAAYTLQTGFGLARHLEHWEAFLIQMLVGGAIQNLMLDQVEFWITRPGSPNLTWSLANLPRPMLNIVGGLEYERAGIGYGMPELASAAAGTLTADGLRSMLTHIHAIESKGIAGMDGMAEVLRRAVTDLPGAKAYLHDEAGYAIVELDAMPAPAILGLYYARSYEQWHDEAVKWYGLPYPQAAPGIARAVVDFQKFRANHPDNPMLAAIPGYQRLLLQSVKSERRVDELRCLEALRAYATAHDGKLPATLREVTDAPVPKDPVTETDFPYTLENGGFSAQLEAPLPAGGSAKDARTYEIRTAK